MFEWGYLKDGTKYLLSALMRRKTTYAKEEADRKKLYAKLVDFLKKHNGVLTEGDFEDITEDVLFEAHLSILTFCNVRVYRVYIGYDHPSVVPTHDLFKEQKMILSLLTQPAKSEDKGRQKMLRAFDDIRINAIDIRYALDNCVTDNLYDNEDSYKDVLDRLDKIILKATNKE